MSNLIDRLTDQLDSLLPFLALAHREVFDVVGQGYGDWLSEEQQSTLPESFQVFERQVAHGAFLIGYSYVEAFLGDLVRAIYLKNPQMLPRDKELKFSDILDQDGYENVLAYMINKEVRAVFYGSMEQIARYFRERLRLPWSQEHESELVRGSRIRNCFLHNMARADNRLAEITEYREGDEITLSPQEVHDFGWVVRDLAPRLFEEATRLYLKS
jgi:hypothetical protein